MPVTAHPFQRWLARAVLALALATPAVLWLLAHGLNADRSYTIEIDFMSSVDGALQVFYDRGGGTSQAESAAMPIRSGTIPEARRLQLPGGTFRQFRIDPPGMPGRYTVAGLRVRDWDDAVVAVVPLSALTPASQLTIVSAGPPLVVDSPPGSNDPQITWTPATPLVLHRDPRSTRTLIAKCLAVCAAAFMLVVVLARVMAPLERRAARVLTGMASRGAERPILAIALAALAGTLAAMYPVVFLGKSLVSPNNGSALLLYDRPPFTPGQRDRTIEELRGVDVGAALWQFVPYSQTERLALAQGEVPLWNRFNGAGRPLWGQGQSLILDPLHWATLIAPDPGIGWDVKFVLHRFVFALGVGVAVLTLTASWPAATSMAVAAPFAGYFLFRLNHAAQFSFTYATWLMWAWFRVAWASSARDRAGAGRWLAVMTALVFVASPPKEAAIMLLCCYTTGALACLTIREAPLLRLRSAAIGGAVALLLSAPHWLIFVNTLAQSLTAYDSPAARFATWPFAVALVFGVLKPGGLLPGAHAVIAAFALASVAAGWATWRSAPARAAILGPAIALAIAFGAIPEKVIVSLPFLANIHQIDFTFMGAAVVLLCLTGGVGVAAIIDTTAEGGAQRMTRALAPTLACAAAGTALLAQSGSLTSLNLFVEMWALLLSAILATLLVPVTRIAALRWPAPLPILTAALVALLLVAPNGLHAVSGVLRLDDVAVQPRGRARLAVSSPAVNAIRADTRGPTRVVGLHEALFPGSQAFYELEGIGGPDALELPHYEELINAAGVQRYWVWNQMVMGSDLTRLARLLDVLNVGYVLTGHGTASQGLPAGAEALTPLHYEGDDLVLAARRPTVWPRAFFVDHVSQYKGAAQFVSELNGSSGPFASIDAEDESARAAVSGGNQAAIQSDERGDARATVRLKPDATTETLGRYEAATNYKLTANRTSFRIHSSGPGVAVLSEAWMARDFVATLNGTATPYFRVNHAFKGVRIPTAGDWTVEFRYRPALWGVSWILAALGLFGLVFFRVAVQ